MEPVVLKLARSVAAAIEAHKDELNELDTKIGDGDHGTNMARGLAAILAEKDKLAALPAADALKACAMALISKVGGASGPLYGSFLLAVSRAVAADPSKAGVIKALAAGMQAVMNLGKAQVGEKTMLDVLSPSIAYCQANLDKDWPTLLKGAAAVARQAADATKGMKATKGRASYLGERSIGTIDPGAESAGLIFEAVASAFEA